MAVDKTKTDGGATQEITTPTFAGITPTYKEDQVLPPMEQFSLVDNQPQQGQFSVFDDGSPNTAIVDPKVLGKKVDKFSFAIGKDFSHQQIKENLANGQEASLRARAAAGEDLKDEQLRSQLIREKLVSGLPEDPREQSVLYQDVKTLNAFKPSNDPSTIIEKLYAQEYVRRMSQVGPEGNLMQQEIAAIGDKRVAADRQKRLEETPEHKLTALMDISEQAVMRQEVFKNHLERIEGMVSKQSWTDWGLDFGKTMAPFYAWYKTANQAAPIPGLTLQGTNMAEQAEALAHLPPAEANKILEEKITNGLAKDNPQLAAYFVQAMISYSSTDQFIDNVTSVLDLASAASSVGKTGLKALSKSDDIAGAFKDFIKANADPYATPADQLAAVGDIKNSAKAKVLPLVGPLLAKAPVNLTPQQVVGVLPSVVNPVHPSGGAALSGAHTSNLANHLALNTQRFSNLLQEQIKVARTPEEALQKAFEITDSEFRKSLVHVNQAIVDAKKVRPEETRANIGSMVYTMAKPDGSPFRDFTEATNWATNQYGLRLGDFKGERVGNSYFIKVERAIDETRDEVRNLLISTNNKTPVHKWLPGFAATRLGAQERVSTFNQGNRLAAIHGQQQLHQIVEELTKGIQLTGDSRDAVIKVMEADRSRMPPLSSNPNAAPPKPGMFLKTENEFEQEFQRLNGRLPAGHETKAYFSAITANKIDWILNNDNMRKQLTRMGAKRTVLKVEEIDPATGLKIHRDTGEFYARKVDNMDLDADPTANVVVYEQGKPHTITSVSEWKNKAQEIENLKKQGYDILHTFNPSRKPGSEVFGESEGVTYIITKDHAMMEVESHPIKYREGWHTVYDYPVYVKQPTIRRVDKNGEIHHIFEGDVVHVGAHSEKEAQRIADAMNQARLMMMKNDPGLGAFLAKNLPYTEKEFRDLFTGINPYYSVDHEFKVVADGETTTDRFAQSYKETYSNFSDTIRSPLNLMNQVDKKFFGARDEDLHYIREGVGGQGQPVFSLEKAEKIDPYSSVSIGLSSMMRNAFMADYRISAVESWLKEFGDLMNVRSKAELFSDSVRHLYNPQVWKELSHTEDLERVKAGEAARKAIVEFLGHPSPLAVDVGSYRMKILNTAYGLSGQKGTDIARAIDEKAIATIGDPFKALRAMAFHTTVGFLNPFHWFQNMMTMGYAVAASPRYGSSGSVAGILSRFLTYNAQPAVVDKMASIAHSFGYNKTHFKEWLDEFKKSGREIIEGDHALRDDFNDPSVFKTATGEVLDKTMYLFKSSERTVRAAAHATAFLEWRTANPGKTLTAEIRNQILARSDMFTLNMTRASAASWQRGALSPATQFMSFPARLMEMMWSGRTGANALTTGEKARILLMNSFLYGVPVGIGGTALGAVYSSSWEDVRRHLIENKDKYGVDPDSGVIQALENGVLSAMAAIVFGESSTLGPQLGPQGGGFADKIRKAMWNAAFGDTKDSSKIDLVDTLLGASMGALHKIVKNGAPLMADMGQIISGQSAPNATILAADMNQLMTTIKTWDQVTKLFVAYNNHAIFASTGEKLGEVNNFDATLYAIFGSKPQEIADAEIERVIVKDRTKIIEEKIVPKIRDFTKKWADVVWERGSEDPDAKAWANKLHILYNSLTPVERKNYAKKIINDDRSLQEKMLGRYPAYLNQINQIEEK